MPSDGFFRMIPNMSSPKLILRHFNGVRSQVAMFMTWILCRAKAVVLGMDLERVEEAASSDPKKAAKWKDKKKSKRDSWETRTKVDPKDDIVAENTWTNMTEDFIVV